MKFQLTSSILLLASHAAPSFAWGTLGHETVAYIATNLGNPQTPLIPKNALTMMHTVSSATTSFFQHILGDTSGDYLASVATYADSFRYTSAGSFSAPFHFIDAQDSPPSSCGVDFNRDCGAKGCIVSAIKNYTQRVQDGGLSAANLAQAAKMIVHFVGDIHQPLHDEALDVGGNTISVTFDGVSTNLHHIWDSNMPEKLIGGYALSDAKNWAASLTSAIKTGPYASSAGSWLTGMKLSDPVASSMIWASDTNAFVCSNVFPQGVAATENVDLGGAYYQQAIPIIEEQIAKAGYRLAAWLNLIATGSTGLS